MRRAESAEAADFANLIASDQIVAKAVFDGDDAKLKSRKDPGGIPPSIDIPRKVIAQFRVSSLFREVLLSWQQNLLLLMLLIS